MQENEQRTNGVQSDAVQAAGEVFQKEFVPTHPEQQDGETEQMPDFYRKCLELRKKSNTLLHGRQRVYLPRRGKIYFYARIWKNIHYLIVCNFSDRIVPMKLPAIYADKMLYPVLCNYAQTGDPSRQDAFTMRPFEARVVRCRV